MPTQPAFARRPSRLRPSLRRASAGFTMVELLTVLAIIGIISGILVLALGRVGHSQQRDATVTTLKRLDNALTEITQSTGGAQKLFTIQLPNIYFPPKDASFDFPNSQFKTWIGVPANAIESQVRTALVLKQAIGTNVNAKRFLDDLPPERKKEMSWSVTEAQVPGSSLLTTAANTTPHYVMPLDAWGNPLVFVFDGLQIGTGTNTSRPFTVASTGTTEMEVGGLTNLISDADKSYYEPPQALAPAPASWTTVMSTVPNPQTDYSRAMDKFVPARSSYLPRKAVTDGSNEYTLRSPDHRPFWMSAGPDGKYETTDDNVYSFGN